MMASSAGSLLPGQPTPQGMQPVRFYPSSTAAEQKMALANGHPKLSGKPPLPHRPAAKPARSDSELSDIAESQGGSDYRAQEDSEMSDTSKKRPSEDGEGVDGGRKRRRTPGLPGASSADVSRAPSADEGAGSGSELEEDYEDPLAVPERVVAPGEEEAQKAALKTSWELVCVLDFLSTFQPYLNLDHLQFSAEELESALVLSNGTGGLLVDLHIGIMKGISTRSNVHPGNWTASLAEKLKAYWRHGGLPGTPPFACRRRREAATYATLPIENRVTALRILCELRLEKDDLHNVVEHALHPPRQSKAARKAAAAAAKAGRAKPAEPELPTMEQMRRPPLARDSSGLLYWYLDHHTTTGTRMYRETPDSLLKGKGKKEQSEPQWELVATSPEELEELGKKLRRSKKKADQTLANVVLDELVPELLERREADLRKQRAAAKIQTQMNNILPDGEGGYGGRSRRARKEVNYSFDAYDAAIRAALRGTGRNAEEIEARTTRSAALLEPRLTAEEEAMLGLRRGRSAHAAEPPLELPPTRRLKPPSTADPTPQQSREPTPLPPRTGDDFEENEEAEDEEPLPGAERSRYERGSPGADSEAEVEISDLGSKEDYREDASLDAGVEDISSLSGGASDALAYQDDPDDEDWR